MESKEIYGRMAAILADVTAIEKTRKNAAQGFQFRGIDDAMNELHGTFAKHSIFLTHELLEHSITERDTRSGGKSFHHISKVKFTFWAPDGSSVSAVGIGEAADTGDKGAGKSMSYALKVCLLQTFLIPTEEEKDPDAHSVEWGKKPMNNNVAQKSKPIDPGLLTDKVIPEEKVATDAKQFAAGPYADDNNSKIWLSREMSYFGIMPDHPSFRVIGEQLHKLCIGNQRPDAQKKIHDWLKDKGFIFNNQQNK